MPAEVLATQEAKYSCLTKTTPDFVRNRNKVTLKHGSGSHDRLVLKDNNRSGMYSSLSTCLYRINFGEIPGMMYWKGRTTIMPSRKRRQNVGSSCIDTCKLRGLNDMFLGALETFQQRHYSGVPWASRHLNNSKKQTNRKNPLHHRSPTSPVTFLATWPICHSNSTHYSDVMMGAMASQITNLAIVYSTVYSWTDQRKYQSSTSLGFVRGIHRWPVNSPHK